MKSNNYRIVKELLSKSEQSELPSEIGYVIIYSFLFKYFSDNLKDYLLFEIQSEELTLDEAYKLPKYQKDFQTKALQMFGYYIKKPHSFYDEIINSKKPLNDFFNMLSQNLIFDFQSRDNYYFNYLFDVFADEIHMDKYSNDDKIYLTIKEIIVMISKLDLFEDDLTFRQAFDIISKSKFFNVDYNQEYIAQILSSLISTQKNYITSAYNPFINNGETLFKLAEKIELGLNNIYGKESDKLMYCLNIVKLYLNSFNLDNICLKQENAMDSIDINGLTFDVILSKIPQSIENYHSNSNQIFEMAKRRRKNKLEEILLENFPVDNESFIQNRELNKALDNLIDKIDISKDYIDFAKGYEELLDCEFLFLINLIDCLNDGGIMAVSISQNFLYKNNLNLLRKYLTHEKNYIDTIINLSGEFEKSTKSNVVIIFKKNKLNKDILFIDMSKDYKTQKNDNGFVKNIILDGKSLTKLCEVFSKRMVVDRFSNKITIDEIIKNEFNLSVSLYVDTFDGEFISLSEVLKQKQKIDLKLSDLDSEIDELVDDLNINYSLPIR